MAYSNYELEALPAWLRFINEALPASSVSRAAMVAAGGARYEEGEYFSLGSVPRQLRRIVSGETKFPSPQDIWGAAEAARGLIALGDGRKFDSSWCAGPLALYAAGRFQMFARIMLGTPDSLVEKGAKLDLLRHADGACATSSPPSNFASTRAKLIADGATEFEIAKAERRFKRLVPIKVNRDRRAWILEPGQEVGFDRGWEKRDQPLDHVAITAAQLAEENPAIGLAKQREIVQTMLRAALA